MCFAHKTGVQFDSGSDPTGRALVEHAIEVGNGVVWRGEQSLKDEEPVDPPAIQLQRLFPVSASVSHHDRIVGSQEGQNALHEVSREAGEVTSQHDDKDGEAKRKVNR